MKTSSGQTQVQAKQKASAPVSETAQKKKALSETLELEDQRESSRAQADLQMSIDQSPRMTAQRKKIASAFGPAIQRKGASPIQQMKKAKGADTLQQKPVQSSGNGSALSVVQRAPEDEAMVKLIQKVGRHSKITYDLLCQQVKVGTEQSTILKSFAGSEQFEGNNEFKAAQEKMSEVADRLKNQILGLPQEASAAHAKAVDLGQNVTTETPRLELYQLKNESITAIQMVAKVQAKASGTLVKIKEKAVEVAQKAMEVGEIEDMRILLKVADVSHAEATRGDSVIVNLKSDDKVKASGKEKTANVVGHLDTANNIGTGVGFSAISIADIALGSAFVLSGVAALALGLIGGILGTVFGAVGVFLGVKSAIRGAQKKKALKKAKGMLSNDDLKDIADYAIAQKGQKVKRGVVAASAGGVALTAGVLGLLSIGVATLGVAALVVGLAAALIGLGMVAYRMIKSWKKRKAERKAFADELIAQVLQKGENEAEAKQMIAKVGMNPDKINEDPKAFSKKLSKKVGGLAKSKREATAGDLVSHLVGGKPSEVFDAGMILGALGMDVAKIREQVDEGETNKAVSKVAGKMASW
ncbi:MAG: hypothetical protein VST69_06985 [Nitrospirota bacterium]|nr:hypothetical protein [Nitrospirota bacterium]